MIHLGDITKLNGAVLPVVDIIIGGSPCQDLSVAGKRAGLAGERSGLFMEQIRIIKEMRENDRTNRRTDEHIRPRYMVWENVPGAFSSNGGEDFHAVLEETAKVAERDARIPGFEGGRWPTAGCIMGNGWSIAWRVHDAQFWGVPQRRKRIALVADFGGSTAPEILFERKSVSGDTESCISPGETVTTDIIGSAEASSYTLKIRGGREIDSHGKKAGKGPLVQAELSATLGVSQDQTLICLNDQGGQRMDVLDDASGTLRAQDHGHQPVVLTTEMTPKIDESGTAFSLRSRDYKDPQSVVYGISAFDSNAMKSDNPNSGVYEADTARTLDNNGGNPACNQGGMAVVEPILLESNQNHATIQTDGISTALPVSAGMGGGYIPMVCIEGNGSRESHRGNGFVEFETMYTLNSTEHHAICIENHPSDSRVKIAEDGKVQTLSSRMGTGGGNVPLVMESSAWDGSQVSSTLTANNVGGGQRMPDKENFNAVIQGINGDVAGTLDASYYKGCGERQGTERDVVAYGLDRAAYNQGRNAKFNFSVDEEKVGALVAKGPGGFFQAVVRRLTPLECERLQGFPDNWTNIGEWIDSKGKKHKDADSPRYKALGNSIALPFWQWMAARMVKYIDHEPTMASLFDGIGGFPLVFSRVGCKPVWASEIEEFPIAVTKIRLQEEK